MCNCLVDCNTHRISNPWSKREISVRWWRISRSCPCVIYKGIYPDVSKPRLFIESCLRIDLNEEQATLLVCSMSLLVTEVWCLDRKVARLAPPNSRHNPYITKPYTFYPTTLRRCVGHKLLTEVSLCTRARADNALQLYNGIVPKGGRILTKVCNCSIEHALYMYYYYRIQKETKAIKILPKHQMNEYNQ